MIRCYLKGQLVAELKDSEREEAVAFIKNGQADKITTFFEKPCKPEDKPKKGFRHWFKKTFLGA